MHRIVLFLMRKIRLFKPDETFDPTTFKTKIIFMATQLVFTVIVSLPTPFLYSSKWASVSLAFFVFLCALWNRCDLRCCLFVCAFWCLRETCLLEVLECPFVASFFEADALLQLFAGCASVA